MNVKDPTLKKWVVENRETLIGQLVLYHSPVSLAEMVVDDQKIDDSVISKIKRRLESSEGLLKKEASKRKKDAKAAPPQKIMKTEEEVDDDVKSEKADETVKACEEKEKSKYDDIFVDDDFVPDQNDEDPVFSQF